MKANMNIASVKRAAARLVLIGGLVAAGMAMIGCDQQEVASFVQQFKSSSASARVAAEPVDSATKDAGRSKIYWGAPAGR